VYAGKPTPLLDPACAEYKELKQEVLRAERHLLLELGFEVETLQEHPHRHLLQIASWLGKSGPLLQQAWSFLNDSMRTLMICAHEPRLIAIASIFLAASATGLKLPSDPPWWRALDADLEDVKHIAKSILALYRRSPAHYLLVPRRKKTVEATASLGPATPFPDTPGPVGSPTGSDGDGDHAGQEQPSVQRQDSTTSLDSGRLAELLEENRNGDSAGASQSTAPQGREVSSAKECSVPTTEHEEETLKRADAPVTSSKSSRAEARKDADRDKKRSDAARETSEREVDKDRKRSDAVERESDRDKRRSDAARETMERSKAREKEREKKRAREKRAARSSSDSTDSHARKKAKGNASNGRDRKATTRRSPSSSHESSSSQKKPRRRKRSVDSREL